MFIKPSDYSLRMTVYSYLSTFLTTYPHRITLYMDSHFPKLLQSPHNFMLQSDYEYYKSLAKNISSNRGKT